VIRGKKATTNKVKSFLNPKLKAREKIIRERGTRKGTVLSNHFYNEKGYSYKGWTSYVGAHTRSET